MEESKDNVVLFPKWKNRLVQESFAALQNRQYEKALSMIDQLMAYDIDDHDLTVGKLICLMELGRYDEAEQFGEWLLSKRNQDYYRYLFIYFSILLHMSEYEQLVHLIKQELNKEAIPSDIKQQLVDLYNESFNRLKDYRKEKEIELIEALTEAIQQERVAEQWQIIENLRSIKCKPTKNKMEYLSSEAIHPVIKTSLFNWLKDMKINDDVFVKKLGYEKMFKPIETQDIKQDVTYKQIILLIRDVEQKNPTLYQLLETVLYRYAYVHYPFSPPIEDAEIIATALKQIGKPYLDDGENILHASVEKYVEELKWCETIYLSVIEE